MVSTLNRRAQMHFVKYKSLESSAKCLNHNWETQSTSEGFNASNQNLCRFISTINTLCSRRNRFRTHSPFRGFGIRVKWIVFVFWNVLDEPFSIDCNADIRTIMTLEFGIYTSHVFVQFIVLIFG